MSQLGSAIGNQWAEARDADKHPTMYRTTPHKIELSDLNVYSAKIEKSCLEGTLSWTEECSYR